MTPTDWQETMLGDASLEILDGDRGKNYPKSDDFFEKEFCLFLNTGNVTSKGFDFQNTSFITREKDSTLRKGKLKPYDLVLTTRGTVGNVAFFHEKVPFENIRINSGMVILRANPKEIEVSFLYLFLRSSLFQEQVKSFSTGSAQPQLPIRDLKNIALTLPPLPEQRAIAEVLSSLDDKIDLLHRQNRTLEALAETLFRQWFIEEANPDWEEKPLESLMTITSSKRIFYKEYVSTGIPFYRSKEIIELHNTGSTNSELFIPIERFKDIESKYGVPQQGDILLTSVGTLGVTYKVKENDSFYFKDGNLTWFKDFNIIPSVIIYCWLNSQYGKEKLDGITIGSTQSALTISGLKSILMQVPQKAIVDKLAFHLESFYSKIESNYSQIQTLERLRDALLPKLMSGSVRVGHCGEGETQ